MGQWQRRKDAVMSQEQSRDGVASGVLSPCLNNGPDGECLLLVGGIRRCEGEILNVEQWNRNAETSSS